MRVIKPGKISGLGKVSLDKPKKVFEKKDTAPIREIWDDYFVEKKTKKKKEYAKGIGDRMIPVSTNKNNNEANDVASGMEVSDEESLLRPSEDFDGLETRFGYVFKRRELLIRALTHRSALSARESADYERLEFLGDAVLDLAVAHLLSDLHPDAREGDLSKMRAALVNTQALAHVARKLELGSYIKLGRGEFSSGGNDRPSILADVMEAIIGAIYRDGGYEIAMSTIAFIFGDSVEQVTPYDPKTELQEVLHIAGSEPPNYLLELVEGPEHAPTFVTVVIVDGEVAGRGRGPTKKGAQQDAAAEAFSRMIASVPSISLVDGQNELIPEAFLTFKLSTHLNNVNQSSNQEA